MLGGGLLSYPHLPSGGVGKQTATHSTPGSDRALWPLLGGAAVWRGLPESHQDTPSHPLPWLGEFFNP